MKQSALKGAFDRELVEAWHATERIHRQFWLDCVACTLNEKYGWGQKRINQLFVDCIETYNHFYSVFDVEDPECDVKREHLDRKLAYICRKDMSAYGDFACRYPDIKTVQYKRPVKPKPVHNHPKGRRH